jgi:hypothetical protein
MASTRRLAAIFTADVAGYSRPMGADQEETQRALQGAPAQTGPNPPVCAAPASRPNERHYRPAGVPAAELSPMKLFAAESKQSQTAASRHRQSGESR